MYSTIKKIIAFSCLVISLGAVADRATEAQLNAAREKNDINELLKDPAGNFGKIHGLFMAGGNPDLTAALETVKGRMQDEGDALPKAALQLLAYCGEREYRRREARRLKNSMLSRGFPKEFLPSLVASFHAIDGMPSEAGPVAFLRARFAREINMLLIDGDVKSMPEPARRAVIDKYLHAVPDPLEAYDVKRTVSIYRFFGLENELDDKCSVPPESLKDDTMLFRAMELSLEMHGVESALQHAKALLRRTGISADMRAKAADIVVQADPAKAVAFLRELADASPLLNISIYEASKLAGGEGGKAGGGDAALHAFCGPLIQRMQEPVQDGNTYSREYALDMYKAGISILQQKGFHSEVLALSSWLDEVPGVDSSDKYWVVQAIKGRSLEALGRVEEAKATYRRVIDTDAFSPRGKTMARNYMKNIGKKKPVPLPHENDRSYQ